MDPRFDFDNLCDPHDVAPAAGGRPEPHATYDEAYGPRLTRGPSVFDTFPWPDQKEEKPAPLPCTVFTRTQVLLYNLRAAGYDLSQVAANDNGRLSAALEVVLCRKRGLEDPEQIARAIGITVDAVLTAVNDLHAAKAA